LSEFAFVWLVHMMREEGSGEAGPVHRITLLQLTRVQEPRKKKGSRTT